MKMNDFIARLKQQPRIGGVPLRPAVGQNIPPRTPAEICSHCNSSSNCTSTTIGYTISKSNGC
jgi:hypothetical protein